MVTTYYKQFFDHSFYCPVDLSPIQKYCELKGAGDAVEGKISRLFQLFLSIIPIINEPYGKWISIGSVFTLGGIKSTLGWREQTISEENVLNFKMRYIATLETGLMVLNGLGQLVNSQKICALQSLHTLVFQTYDLLKKPSLELFLETLSTLLYLSTFLSHDRMIGYRYQQAFLASQAFLAGYRFIRATLQAYRDPALRTDNVVEATLHSVMLIARIRNLHSLQHTVQLLSKELEERAIVLMQIPKKPYSLQIPGQEHKKIHVITAQEGQPFASPETHQVTVDEQLNPYPTPRPSYPKKHTPDAASRKELKPLALEYDARMQERTIRAVNTHVAQPEEGTLKVLMLRPSDLAIVKNHMLKSSLDLSPGQALPSNQDGAYALFTVRDSHWTLWESKTLQAQSS
jgi:hypothetical protein